MSVVKKLAFLVLLAVHTVNASTLPSSDVKGSPNHEHPPKPTPSHTTTSHKTSSSHSTSSSAVFSGSTPPASLSVPAAVTAGQFMSTDFLKAYFPGFGPTQTSVEPQPVITDPVTHEIFPLDLTNPKTIPTANLEDPIVLPPSLIINSPTVLSPKQNLSTPGSIALRETAFNNIMAILHNATGSFPTACSQCMSSLPILKQVALAVPWEVPPLLIALCEATGASSFGGCSAEFSANSDGAIETTVIYFANVTGLDGQYICSKGIVPLHKSCPAPPPPDNTELLKTWFKKPKPANAVAPKPSGKKPLRVVHISDFHIDPRYTIGAEASCDQFLCCRPTSNTTAVPHGQILMPAPRFGSFECDSPWLLANAVMHAIGTLTGTKGEPETFTIFTGDLTSHDNDDALGRDYLRYTEAAVYQLFKQYLNGPVYAAMGNHDTYQQAFDIPHILGPRSVSQQFQWNYDHLADLWQTEGWIDEQTAEAAKKTYSAYSVHTKQGLKIITLNTDFWYNDNDLNCINATNPDMSSMLRFLTDELQEAEDAGERVWIVGHVLLGWSATNSYPGPSDLFYQIVDRFSPHVIANIFMGHIHDEVRYLYYANNGTVMNENTAVATTWVGGSVTPLAGLNSGFSMYEVDPETFDIMEAYTWYSNVSSYPELDREGEGPEFKFEYSTRDVYGGGFDWPATAPLNATWWHKVSKEMETNPDLVTKFTLNQGRQSSLTQNCTSTECQEAKICYLRSGSPQIAARCPTGFGSVQE